MTTALFIPFIALLFVFRQPLYLIISAITAFAIYFWGDQFIQGLIADIIYAIEKEVLLAIPFFIFAGTVMKHGSISRRLIRFGDALIGFIPGGMAITSVFSCAVFAAIVGSSPVTVLAIGGILYPILSESGYPRRFSMGLLTSAGSLGIIIPPSIPMILFGIMTSTSITKLFIAGILPGLLIAFLMIVYSSFRLRNEPNIERKKFSLSELIIAFKSGFWAIMMPVIILCGIYLGFFTPTEASAVAVVYALIVELVLVRELKITEVPAVIVESAKMLGALFLILMFCVAFNKFLIYQEIPQQITEGFLSLVSSKIMFILIVNLLLLLVGCFMDVISAILVLAPILTPAAIHYGINPIHFGIIFIVNLEIGYLTPPVGINLFVANSLFKRPFPEVIRSVLPFLAIMLLSLLLISFIPQISLLLT